MRNTRLYALLSVVVLAAALAIGVTAPPAEAQFASNNRSVKLRATAAGNVSTPASGYFQYFRDTATGALMVKDSGGLISASEGYVAVTNLAAATTVTAGGYAGEVIVFDGTVGTGITLPEITASNIGMRFTIVAKDTDDLSVVCITGDTFTDATDGTVDANLTIIATSAFATAEIIAISASEWLVIPTGTWTIE